MTDLTASSTAVTVVYTEEIASVCGQTGLCMGILHRVIRSKYEGMD